MEIGLDKSPAVAGAPPVRHDWSATTLVASNLITIVFALGQHWSLAVLMWIYWGQSVIIGVFNFVRMWTLKDFTTEGLKINDHPVDPTPAAKRQTAIFFLFHYGFFHLVYGMFLLTLGKIPRDDMISIGACVAMFLANHGFSFRYNREADAARKPNLGTIMFFPYARILPLHLTILFGFVFRTSAWAVLLFLLLKTVADLIMHAVEHRRGR